MRKIFFHIFVACTRLSLELGSRCQFHPLIVLHFTYEGQTGADVVCSCSVIREALCNGSKSLK